MMSDTLLLTSIVARSLHAADRGDVGVLETLWDPAGVLFVSTAEGAEHRFDGRAAIVDEFAEARERAGH